MKEVLKPIASGRVEIYEVVNGVKQLLHTSKNAILPNHLYLLSKLMLNDVTARITNIEAFLGAASLAVANISTYTYVAPNEAKFEATFSAGSFSGNFDKLTLGTATPLVMGNFSELTGLALNKTAGVALLISWNIKFN